MKSLLIAAIAVLTPPSAALAQVAAATVPNSFETPAAQSRTPAPAPAPAPAERPALSPTPANAQSEDLLRALIAGAQGPGMDYGLMTDGLAAKVREQEATITPLIKGFGPVQAVDFLGSTEGSDLFVVTFATQATEWIIGVDPAGKVAALLFRPAP